MNFGEARLSAAEILGRLKNRRIGENSFNVGRLDQSFIRIGYGSRGPSILIDGSRSIGVTPLNLQYIVVRPNLNCEVESDGSLFQERVTVIELIESETEVRDDFLTFAAVLACSDASEDGEMQVLIDGLVELLRQQNRESRTSAIGLWGELFTIWRSKDANVLISSWHAIPSARHDFSKDGFNIEVKTSTQGRRHKFSSTQLLAEQNVQTLVVSLLTEMDEDGCNISGLVDQILCLDEISAENRMHLQNMARKSLGRNWDVGSRFKFSTKLAVSSQRFFWAGNIPQISETPIGVSDVHFESDLEFAPNIPNDVLPSLMGIHASLGATR